MPANARPRRDFSPITSLTVAALVAIVILAVSLPLMAWRIDSQVRVREEQFVSSGVSQAMSNLMNVAGSAANWDEMLRHTDNRVDEHWLQTVLTSSTEGDPLNRLVAVVGAGDRPIFEREHAKPVSVAREAAVTTAIAELVARIRAREPGRPMAGHFPLPLSSAAWISEAATVPIEGRPAFVVATLVGPDIGQVALTQGRGPILVIASDLETSLLPNIDLHLLLRDAVLVSEVADPRLASFPFADVAGRTVALLAWVPSRPGLALLQAAVLPLAAPLLALLGAIFVACRQGRRSARVLHDSEARASHLADHDVLTALPNRRMLVRQIDSALEDAARGQSDVAVLLLDLDQFKYVNDTHGHLCGDQLLQEVSRRLAALCRDGDSCARLGGDEFVILAPGCGQAGALAIGQRIQEALASPIVLPGAVVYITSAIGISLSPNGTVSSVEMLRHADLALYKAKETGRGMHRVFEIEMDQAVRQRRALEADLRKALEGGEIDIAYQPQFDRDRLVGLEALARWVHPERGPISPAYFVPLAEECGLIDALGRYVMRRAFADSRRWKNLRIAINVSARQMGHPGFLSGLRELVTDMRVDPRHFELELTESLLLADDAQVHATLSAVREMGFGLALDDFGTGYSSLSYLTRFPITKIKIDRSFVANLPGNEQSDAIVRAIVRLASALALDVIAEGVETTEQRERLSSIGCRQVQGYLTGRPIPAEQIALFHIQLPERGLQY